MQCLLSMRYRLQTPSRSITTVISSCHRPILRNVFHQNVKEFTTKTREATVDALSCCIREVDLRKGWMDELLALGPDLVYVLASLANDGQITASEIKKTKMGLPNPLHMKNGVNLHPALIFVLIFQCQWDELTTSQSSLFFSPCLSMRLLLRHHGSPTMSIKSVLVKRIIESLIQYVKLLNSSLHAHITQSTLTQLLDYSKVVLLTGWSVQNQ